MHGGIVVISRAINARGIDHAVFGPCVGLEPAHAISFVHTVGHKLQKVGGIGDVFPPVGVGRFPKKHRDHARQIAPKLAHHLNVIIVGWVPFRAT